MPSTPVSTKLVSSYTTSDVVGAIVTKSEKIPQGHKYRDGQFIKGIKANWPSTKDKTKIDEMVQIVLDAPANCKENELSESFNNVRFVIQEVMEVSDSDKADAFIRIVGAQTNPIKVKRAKKFASEMFKELLDARLLAYEKEALDDATEYTEEHAIAEGKPRRTTSTRLDAKLSLMWTLKNWLKVSINAAQFETTDETENCALLKTWLTNNWTLVENACTQIKSDPARPRHKVSISPWDARWDQ